MNSTFLQFSSITKKIWMSLLGLFLIIFLVVHLGINLCLLRDDGGKWFRDAAHFMGTNYIVKIMEVILFAGFFFHILLGIILQIRNWFSRPIRYKVTNKTTTPFLSKYMIYTGSHRSDLSGYPSFQFLFHQIGWVSSPVNPLEGGEPDYAAVAKNLFSQPILFQHLYNLDHRIGISSLSCISGGISDTRFGS
jgi:succinate dehydrogenase/fumarate reductase cytochrome b subunit (b558 family)